VKLYGAIDLHSNNAVSGLIDGDDVIIQLPGLTEGVGITYNPKLETHSSLSRMILQGLRWNRHSTGIGLSMG